MKFLFLFLSLLLLNCEKKDFDQATENNLSATIPNKQINGVDPDLLSLDIYYNNKTEIKKPVIIYIDGGGWCVGDKSNRLENKINLFKNLQYILISVNYRLSPYPFEIDNPNRIKYPVHNKDIADALVWIVNNIAEYGGDKNKMALLGHSAGAHLVALTGTNHNFLEEVGISPSIIKGVAVIDTEGYDINEQITNGDLSTLYINAFGTDPLLNREASPIYNITPSNLYPKFFIAKRGSAKRIKYADDFIAVLEANGVSVSQINGSIYDHEEINHAIGEPNETIITEPLIKFLAECFR